MAFGGPPPGNVASGRSLEGRQGLARALQAIRAGEAGGLVVARPDRLSRSVIEAAQTIERARLEGRTWSPSTSASTSPPLPAMAHMTAVFAQLERRLIGERTRAALAMRRAQGVRLGRPPGLPEQLRGGSASSAVEASPCRRSPNS